MIFLQEGPEFEVTPLRTTKVFCILISLDGAHEDPG